jgi:hypothetical protein
VVPPERAPLQPPRAFDIKPPKMRPGRFSPLNNGPHKRAAPGAPHRTGCRLDGRGKDLPQAA